MSYKRDVIMQIKDEERMKKMSIALAKKLEKMTQEQREEFIEKLTKKIRIINAELKDLDTKEEYFKERKSYRCMPAWVAPTVTVVSTLVFGIASGIIAGTVFNAVFDVAMLSLAVGLFPGFGLGYFGSFMLEDKTISNFIAAIKESSVDIKREKINKNKNTIQLQLEKAQEFSK